MLDELFNLLYEESVQFMQYTYLHSCNVDFRKHPDSYIKACILFEQYALQFIGVDFNNKGIRITGSSMIRDFETKTNFAPLEVFYGIDNGLASIAKLIIAYNRITYGRKLFSIDNNMLIIKGDINHWQNINEIENLEIDSVLSSSIGGGEERIKELVGELNNRIVSFNDKLLNEAYIICSN